jgi:hypothetical protein
MILSAPFRGLAPFPSSWQNENCSQAFWPGAKWRQSLPGRDAGESTLREAQAVALARDVQP